MSFEIRWQSKGVLVAFRGVIPIEELDEANETLYGDIRFTNCLYQIFDFGLADLSQIKLVDVAETAAVDASISQAFPNPSFAIVTQQPIGEALVFHYKMMWEAHHMKWEIKMFRNVEDAYTWSSEIT